MSAPAAARMSGQGVRTVAGLELKQRARTSRWPVVLGAWFLLIAAVALLTWYGISSQDQTYQDLEGATHTESAGRSMYDLTTFFVLGLSMLIVPSLTATSINSDREQGVLATLQTTLLSPADIVIGKWVASICMTLVFLATALPFLIWGWVAGHAGPWPILRSMVALLAVLAVISAMGLMFSTLTARPVGSAVLTYLAVATLVIGTLIAFMLSLKPFESVDTVQVRTIPQSWYEEHPNDNPTTSECVTTTQEQVRVHTEKTWWLLAMNPVVIVADAGFVERSDGLIDTSGTAPMAAIAEPYIRRRALRHLEKGRVVIFGAGMGLPYFSTDTTAAQRALEIRAEVVLMAKAVDGVFTADPRTDPDAKLLTTITHREVIDRGLAVADATAFSLCMDNKMPIMVFNLLTDGNIARAVAGEKIGTLVTT